MAMTEEAKRRVSIACLASARRRRRQGLKPGSANDPLVEAERRRKISEARTGMKFTDEHKKKLSQAHAGLLPSRLTKRRMAEAHRKRFRLAKKTACQMCASVQHTTRWHRRQTALGQKVAEKKREELVGNARPWMCGPHTWMVGEKNPRWKGGGPYKGTRNFRTLRALVLARDGYVCFQCGCADRKKLVVHHIDRNSQHTYLDNLITLCRGDNGRAEHEPWKKKWEKKFRKYTQSIVYELSQDPPSS